MEIIQGQKKLRQGYTTGSCATAATKAALCMLLTGEDIDKIGIDTPKGVRLQIPVYRLSLDSDGALIPSKPEGAGLGNLKSAACSVIKDAGDDPDVTNGLHIFSRVTVSDDETQALSMKYDHQPYECELEVSGKNLKIYISGGRGVGLVTKKGLSCDVGKSAINPVPRAMMLKEIKAVLDHTAINDLPRQIWVEIEVQNGEQTALKTFNPKLGIIGGISILGTSGIVEPMSEKALVDTIKTEIKQFAQLNMHDGAKSETVKPMLVCPGNYGQDFARNELGIDLDKGVKCSNYLGETLDYSCYLKIPKILLVGHGGKLIKLAAGVMNTHSSTADGRQEIIASHSALQGADIETLKDIMEAISIEEMVDIMIRHDTSENQPGRSVSGNLSQRTFESIEQKIREHIDHRTRKQVQVEYIIFTKAHGILIQSSGARDMISQLGDQECGQYTGK